MGLVTRRPLDGTAFDLGEAFAGEPAAQRRVDPAALQQQRAAIGMEIAPPILARHAA